MRWGLPYLLEYMTPNNDIQLVDAENQITFDGDQLVFKRTQDIDDNFFKKLEAEREATRSEYSKLGDFALAASIPTVVVEQWMVEGFNIFDPNNKLEDIIKYIKRYDMEKFLGTEKRLV